MKKKHLKQDLEIMAEYCESLENELYETQEKLNSANRAVKAQTEHIEMLNRQLEHQDKAIKRKDMQFLGLRSAYCDDLVNGFNR